MHRSACAVFVSTLILALSGTLSAAIVEITDVPNYSYYEGCGPTAGGMIIGFWDAHGAPNLIPGSNDWATNQQAIKDMMASPKHFYDYVGYGPGVDRLTHSPPVDPGTPDHADNSLADFMWSSRGGLAADSESFEGKQIDGLIGYAKKMGYTNASGSYESFYYLWARFVTEINAGRPMEFYVGLSDSTSPDHFVTAFGYDDTQDHLRYKFYDTTGGPAQWADFAQFAPGTAWSVFSGTYFTAPEPATFAFLAFGCAGLVARARKRRALPYKIAG